MAVMELQGEAPGETVRQRVNEMLTQELEAAVQLISDHREEVDALVEQLLPSNSLRGEQIETILSRKA
jgi:ATP-dependent Zn protease